MGKIKLNLVSGNFVEKPLITAFKGSNGDYVVLDNEMTGSMGLPIILVCKLENNKLVKINDQTEWGMVKENLKSIIAGGEIKYISVLNNLAADDVFYTQLTLPIPSYDTLKNSYKVESSTSNGTTDTATIFDINPQFEEKNINNNEVSLNTTEISSTNPTVENGTPIQNVAPDVNINPTPVENNNMNTINNINPFNQNSSNVQSTPVIDFGIQMPQVENKAVESTPTPISPVMPEAPKVEVSPAQSSIADPISQQTPITSPVNNVSSSINMTDNIFKEQKEAFMQACENMFDALVQRFEKELDKYK